MRHNNVNILNHIWCDPQSIALVLSSYLINDNKIEYNQ